MFEEITGWLIYPFVYVWMGTKRIFIIYLLSAIIIAIYIYLYRRFRIKEELPSLWNYLFPKSIYYHPSARQDYKFFYMTIIVEAVLLIPLVGFITPAVALFTMKLLNMIPISINVPVELLPHGSLLTILCTFIAVLVADFTLFFSHYLQHKIPWLWEFHKVHHTAKVLTPITLYRMHPMDNVFSFTLTSFCVGIVYGIYQYFLGPYGVIINYLGVNIFFIIFYFAGYNLRHSHVWLSYGPVVSNILISPAQHQIHHSSEEKHIDKNMGLMFAFWDKFFSTLYIPEKEEKFSLGITSQKEQEELEGDAFRLFWIPFKCILNQIKNNKGLKKSSITAVLIFVTCFSLMGICKMEANSDAIKVDPKIYLENLTWQEADKKIQSGYKSVIIPTGGIEQSGPHLALGKHNAIVQYTAGHIAERIGHILVAPVITYVPEEAHARFPGTISISTSLFEQLLTYTVISLQRHGFKTIYLLGDSGSNQKSQENVANKLSEVLSAQGVQVINLDQYYFENGQQKWLLNKGLKLDEIGMHAGIKDTSELLYISPEKVRIDKFADNKLENFENVGADGNSSKANKHIGKELIELKINAAIRQIKRYDAKASSLK